MAGRRVVVHKHTAAHRQAHVSLSLSLSPSLRVCVCGGPVYWTVSSHYRTCACLSACDGHMMWSGQMAFINVSLPHLHDTYRHTHSQADRQAGTSTPCLPFFLLCTMALSLSFPPLVCSLTDKPAVLDSLARPECCVGSHLCPPCHVDEWLAGVMCLPAGRLSRQADRQRVWRGCGLLAGRQCGPDRPVCAVGR